MEIETRKIQKEGMCIIYTLHIKKVKNITLRIDEKGSLIVTSNAFVPKAKIDEFVFEKLTWIVRKQQKAIEKAQMYYEDILAEDYFYLFGKKLKVVRIFSNQNYVRYDDECFFVYYSDEKKAHKSVVQFINKTCEKEFVLLVETYYEQLRDYHFPFPTIYFKNMKSRWGSCTPSKNQIVLNTRMVHYPKRFIESVVLHELVHFIQPNHSQSFYRILEFYMPDYKERQKIIHE